MAEPCYPGVRLTITPDDCRTFLDERAGGRIQKAKSRMTCLLQGQPKLNGHFDVDEQYGVSDLRGNERIRALAHAHLDALFDSVDGVQGAFGSIVFEVPYQNGWLGQVDASKRLVLK